MKLTIIQKIKGKIQSYLDKKGYILIRKPIKPFIHHLKGRKDLVGVEIGVWKGNNTIKILENLNIKKLYLVDPYEVYDEYEEPIDKMEGIDIKIKSNMDKIKKIATTKLKKYKESKFIFEKSEKAADIIKDNLDFVYIDGNHNYKYVLKDIKNFYPKIKKGGIIAGDNWDYLSVVQAVLKCFDANEILISYSEWIVVKK